MHVNRKFCQLFELPEAEIVGKQIKDLVTEKCYFSIKDAMSEQLSGRSEVSEYTLATANGNVYDVSSFGSTVSYQGVPALLMLIEDISNTKRIEKDLRESEERYRTIFDQSYDAILLYDGKSIFQCNRQALKYLRAEKVRMSREWILFYLNSRAGPKPVYCWM